MSPIIGAQGGLSARAFGFGSLAPAGDFLAITTATVDSGESASITFNSIPSIYKHLQIRGMTNTNYGTNDQGYLSFQLNSDTGSNYSRHQLTSNGAAAGGYGAGGLTNGVIGFDSLSGSRNLYFCHHIIDIFDYQSTAKTKTLRGLSGQDFNGSGDVGLFSSVWINSSTAANSVKLYSTNGNLRQFSSFALYGIKG